MTLITTGRITDKKRWEEAGWLAIDTTVKSATTARSLAPTWSMVMGYKDGTVSEEAYTKQYMAILERARKEELQKWENTIRRFPRIVFLCYCPVGNFCHRILLAEEFVRFGLENDLDVLYLEEDGNIPPREKESHNETTQFRHIIIAGCRTFNDYEFLKKELDKVLTPDDVIISGGARGADSLGERYARENRMVLIYKPADWDSFGKSAGYKRNEEMAEIADVLIAFWDGKSKGTGHMIDIAKRKGLLVRIVDIAS